MRGKGFAHSPRILMLRNARKFSISTLVYSLVPESLLHKTKDDMNQKIPNVLENHTRLLIRILDR